MAFFDPLEHTEQWQRLYETVLARGAELRGRVDRGDERPLGRLAEATVSVCVLASASAGIDVPEAYPPEVAVDVLRGAEHRAVVAAWLLDLALVAHGREHRYPAHEWRYDALRYAQARARQDRGSTLAQTGALVHNVAMAIAEAIVETERDPLCVPEHGAMALGDLVELHVRTRAAVARVPTCA